VRNLDDDEESPAAAYGIILGPLQTHRVDHIQVGDVVLFLTDGATCNDPIGTLLRVTYAEREGIKQASRAVRAE
jgi:hypothetical protein